MGMDIKKGSLSYILLTILEKSVDGLVRYDDLIHHSHSYAWGSGWEKSLKKSAVSKAIARLKGKGFVEKDKTDVGSIILKLTDAIVQCYGNNVKYIINLCLSYQKLPFDFAQGKMFVCRNYQKLKP